MHVNTFMNANGTFTIQSSALRRVKEAEHHSFGGEQMVTRGCKFPHAVPAILSWCDLEGEENEKKAGWSQGWVCTTHSLVQAGSSAALAFVVVDLRSSVAMRGRGELKEWQEENKGAKNQEQCLVWKKRSHKVWWVKTFREIMNEN